MEKLSRHRFKFLIIGGIFTELFYLLLTLSGGGTNNIPLYMFIYFETFLVMLFCYSVMKVKKNIDDETGSVFFHKILDRLSISETSSEARYIFVIIFFGILFRLTLFPTDVVTSPDVNRYVWEGKVINNGYNPYSSAPDDAELFQLRDNVYDKLTFKHIPAIYPPAAQYVFAAAYFFFGEDTTGLKLIYLLCELISFIFILKLLEIKKIPLNRIILYAWLPLPIMEYFVNAHIDPLLIMFLTMFVYYSEKKNLKLSAFFLALSVLSKVISIILFPLILKQFGFKRSFVFILLFAVTIIAGYLPFIYEDIYVLTALNKYAAKWEFNASTYYLLKLIFADGTIARIICYAGLLISIFIISFKYKDFSKAVYAVLIAFIVFAATLYPWYLGWIAVLNPMFNFYSVSSLLFTINFSNFTPLAPEWKEYVVVLLIQYIPFYVLLGYEISRKGFNPGKK